MKYTKEVRAVKVILDFYECDSCHRHILSADILELQEMLHINFVGGYASIFGDNEEFAADICQYCVKKLLGDIIRRK